MAERRHVAERVHATRQHMYVRTFARVRVCVRVCAHVCMKVISGLKHTLRILRYAIKCIHIIYS